MYAIYGLNFYVSAIQDSVVRLTNTHARIMHAMHALHCICVFFSDPIFVYIFHLFVVKQIKPVHGCNQSVNDGYVYHNLGLSSL